MALRSRSRLAAMDDDSAAANCALCVRVPTCAMAPAKPSVSVALSNSVASRSASSALALPASRVYQSPYCASVALPTVTLSPVLGTPFRVISQPSMLMGLPGA